jgi:hypothetical protein
MSAPSTATTPITRKAVHLNDEAPLELIEFEPSSSFSSSSTRPIENGHRSLIREVGSNVVDSNETVSLDGNLEGKQFLRLSVGTSVNGMCKIFKCKQSQGVPAVH